MIRTRCKFRVIGVEAVEHRIFRNVFKDEVSEEEYAAIPSPEYTQSGRPYKSVDTGKNATNVRLAASYDTKNPEDVSFAEATPSGQLTIYVSNPQVVGHFAPGQNYYVDLIPCE